MRRRLTVMRHASAVRADKEMSDHERPLTDGGWNEAAEIAERLVEAGWPPQIVISSDATRTRETFEAMEPAFDSPPPVVFDESLYLAGMDAAQRAVLHHAEDATDVLLLGHNPGWQAIISYLAGHRERLLTANAVLLAADAESWEDVMHPSGFELVDVLRPRGL